MMMEIIQIDLMFQVYLRSMCKLFLNNPRLIQLRLTNKLNGAFSWFLNNFYEKTHLYLRSYKNKNAIASTFCVIQLLKNLTEFIFRRYSKIITWISSSCKARWVQIAIASAGGIELPAKPFRIRPECACADRRMFRNISPDHCDLTSPIKRFCNWNYTTAASRRS